MITVMLASYNGGERLKRTLDSMSRVRPPPDGWRLIAVDNRSTDGSHAVMLSYKGSLPIEVMQEPTPGKNHALNRALERALANDGSDLFVFCDDDVLVAEDWLEQWRAVVDARPDYTAFAGLTLADWPSEIPEWVLRLGLLRVLYAVHQNVPQGECDMRYMHGTNMGVRASVFRDGHRFNPVIGPDGSSTYAMGSETEFAQRLEKLGHKCWFAVEAVVRHIVRPEQLETAWVLKRGYRFGRGSGAMGEPHNMAMTPRSLMIKNVTKAITYPWLLALLPQQEAELRRWQWAYDRGYEDGVRLRMGRPARWDRY